MRALGSMRGSADAFMRTWVLLGLAIVLSPGFVGPLTHPRMIVSSDGGGPLAARRCSNVALLKAVVWCPGCLRCCEQSPGGDRSAALAPAGWYGVAYPCLPLASRLFCRPTPGSRSSCLAIKCELIGRTNVWPIAET